MRCCCSWLATRGRFERLRASDWSVSTWNDEFVSDWLVATWNDVFDSELDGGGIRLVIISRPAILLFFCGSSWSVGVVESFSELLVSW